MTKEELRQQTKYLEENEIDERTLPLIVHHYVSIGEQAAANLTDEQIEKVYQKAAMEAEEADKQGRTSLITPEFQRYILKACQQLYLLPPKVRNNIIKKNI